MKVFFVHLNPCNTRKVNIRQYIDFVSKCNHKIVDRAEDADIIFVWGCEFRADWRDFSFSVVKELKDSSSAKIVYIGCTFDKDYASKIKSDLGIEVIPWKDGKGLFEAVISEHEYRLRDTNINLAENRLVENSQEYRKSNPLANISFEDEYVKLSICEGCNNNCSYCSERHMFPAFKSFPEENLVNDCKKAVLESNTNRVMLLADSSGAYGLDTGSSLPDLIDNLKINVTPDLEIGISQLNPEHFIKHCDRMIDLVKQGTIKYINLPIQSASDKILSLMRRKYNVAEIEKIFTAFNDMQFKDFSTHLLLGFPSENMEDVEKSINFIIRYHPRHVVVSAFMSHPSIDASTYDNQVSQDEVKRRIQLCEKRLTENGIKVATDWGSVTKKIMNRIGNSFGLDSINYEK